MKMKNFIWTVMALTSCVADILAYSKVSTNSNGQGRSSGSKDISFTVSPVYIVTPKTDELRPGEAVDHPSTPTYSTLDKEAVAKLDKITGRQRAQDRFHPPSRFEHVIAHSNALRQQKKPQSIADLPLAGSSSSKDVVFSKPIVSMTYDYPSTSIDANSKPSSRPSSSSDDLPVYPPLKPLDTYQNGGNDDPPPPREIINYNKNKSPSFDFDHPPKSIDFPGHYDQPFEDVPSYAEPEHLQPHEEIIYDHIPDDHYIHHHYHPKPSPTTAEPEMMDQRLNKHYSYYYIGKKLWYIPLYFSIYFIIYIAALVLKSVARHKINFPSQLAAAAGADNARSQDGPAWTDYVVRVLDAIDKYGKYVVK